MKGSKRCVDPLAGPLAVLLVLGIGKVGAGGRLGTSHVRIIEMKGVMAMMVSVLKGRLKPKAASKGNRVPKKLAIALS